MLHVDPPALPHWILKNRSLLPIVQGGMGIGVTPWLKNYLRREKTLQAHAKADLRRCVSGLNCLTVCGLRDGLASVGQFCIATRLAYALKGDVKKGLFFRGSEKLPFGSAIRRVGELVDCPLTGIMPELPAIGAC